MDVGDELAEAMRELEYDERWILYGFISGQEIVAEYAEYKFSLQSPTRPLDPAGNRRHATYLRWVRATSQFSDEAVDEFIELGRSDSNQSMFADVLVQTLRIAALRLTQAQWEQVVRELGVFDGARGIVERTRLLRRLASEPLSKALMRACVDSMTARFTSTCWNTPALRTGYSSS